MDLTAIEVIRFLRTIQGQANRPFRYVITLHGDCTVNWKVGVGVHFDEQTSFIANDADTLMNTLRETYAKA